MSVRPQLPSCAVLSSILLVVAFAPVAAASSGDTVQAECSPVRELGVCTSGVHRTDGSSPSMGFSFSRGINATLVNVLEWGANEYRLTCHITWPESASGATWDCAFSGVIPPANIPLVHYCEGPGSGPGWSCLLEYTPAGANPFE